MRIRYDGPRSRVGVAPYGDHRQGEEKDYPDDVAAELLATSKKQRFVAVDERSSRKTAVKEEAAREADPEMLLLGAAKMCVDAGEVTGAGKPKVEAMAALLERNVTAAERDRAWELLAGGGTEPDA